MPRFEGILGLVGFLILTYLLFENSSGASRIIKALANNSASLITTLQGR